MFDDTLVPARIKIECPGKYVANDMLRHAEIALVCQSLGQRVMVFDAVAPACGLIEGDDQTGNGFGVGLSLFRAHADDFFGRAWPDILFGSDNAPGAPF